MFHSTADFIRRRTVDVYAQIATSYDEAHGVPWAGFEDLLSYIKNGSKVLDVGCGNGWVFGAIKDKKPDYLGIDNSSSMLETAQIRFPSAQFKLGDMIDLNMPKDSFDVVFCLAALHHIPGRSLRKQCVQEIYDTLKPNGVLILTVWNSFRFKFLKQWMVSVSSFILHFGFKFAWNDLWIPWRNSGPKRYFHAFLPRELLSYFDSKKWKVETFYFLRKGSRVKFWRAFNFCLVVRKK